MNSEQVQPNRQNDLRSAHETAEGLEALVQHHIQRGDQWKAAAVAAERELSSLVETTIGLRERVRELEAALSEIAGGVTT